MKRIDKMIKATIVTRLDRVTLETDSITMDEAIQNLNGYWKENQIEWMLKNGDILWTPYFDYFIAVE